MLMKHGWKTRIEERKYFEEKKEQREHERVLRRMALAQLESHVSNQVEQLRRNNELN
jgi:hypothetical protein